MKEAARHRSSRASLAAAAIALLVVGCATASAADPVLLRWKLEPGQVVRYSVVLETSVESRAEGGQGVRNERRQEVDLRWVVGKVEGDVADLTLIIERIRLKFEADSRPIAFAFDTAAPTPPPADGPFSAKMTELLRGLVGAEVAFRMSPRGEVSDVKPSASLNALIRQAGSLGGARLFSDLGLRNLIGQSVPYFPEAPVSAGSTWTRQVSAPMPMFGALIIDKTYTDGGPRAGDTGVRDVAVEARVSLQPSPEAALEMKVLKQSAAGSFAFDARRGLTESGRLDESLTTAVSAQGQRVEQSIATRLEVKLLPGGDPAR